MNFVEELKWRGQLHDIMPGTEDQLNKETTNAYIGFDPTADSLHVGSLAQIILLRRFQQCGHKPFALIGGATGMVGDPSGRSTERNLLDNNTLQHNLNCLKNQLSKFLDFDAATPNAAELVNNHDWFKEINVLDFLRDVGKHITVSYMLAKDSVFFRMERESGISYTEFTYQLIQGYDFQHLYTHKNCKLQMGGSDQWGNIVTGTELIRRMGNEGAKAYAISIQLVTRADGSKFGKSATGDNVWLDANKTSPYKFYQFWLNQADDDASKYIRFFSFKTRHEIETLEAEHAETPHLRLLQKALAQELTTLVHSQADYEQAVQTSDILFKGNIDDLRNLPERDLLEVMEGVEQHTLNPNLLAAGIDIVSLLGSETKIFSSKSEARKAVQANSITINKTKVSDITAIFTPTNLLHNKYLLVQKGKKNYYLIVV